MAFTMFGRTTRKIGVIGSGNIGPDIALHFSQNLYAHGVPVVVVDILQAALDSGSKKAESKTWIQPLSATLGFEDLRRGFKSETFSRTVIEPVFDFY
jgi:3-hydroxyacyl-CoA dehydrogenase